MTVKNPFGIQYSMQVELEKLLPYYFIRMRGEF